MLGKTLTGRYKIVKQLGGGGFSQTFIAEDGYLPDRPSCVIKQLKPASSQLDVLKISRDLFNKEAKVLYRLGKHDCIPSLLAHFEEDEEFFLAQELIEGDVLIQEIKRGQCLGEQYIIDLLIDILPTLDFVHRQQVIHRDIKPSNLIRRTVDKKIVLIDFGAVKEVSTQPISQLGQTSSLVIGSPGYMPNEQYSGKTMFASDIYALGIVTIQALTGLLPNQIPEDPVTSELCWRECAIVTPTLADIIDKMVRFDFRQRYQSAIEVLSALQPLLTQSSPQSVLRPDAQSTFGELLIPTSDNQKNSIELLIEEVSDDLEMSEDPVRAKKLVCLVCTGILENDLKRLDNFNFVELLQDLYHQYPTIEALKENIVKSVKTISVPKQRQYMLVAKVVFNAVSRLYPKAIISEAVEPAILTKSILLAQPISAELSYMVEHLVINAGSAQVVTPFDKTAVHLQINSQEESLQEPTNQEISSGHNFGFTEDELSVLEPHPNEESDIYAWVAHNIDTDVQQMRLKKLLFYTYQNVWESDLRQLNSINWASLLRELVSFMPTFPQLMALIHEAVQRVSKPAEYHAIGDLLLTKLEHLYPDSIYVNNNFEEIATSDALIINQADKKSNRIETPTKNKVPFDPQIVNDLFDLRLELMRFTNSMRAKILLFSILYYPFNPDIDNWHDLKTHGLDGLLRQLFYAYPSFAKAENSVLQTARSLSEPDEYEQSASYVLQAVKTLYDQLEFRSMHHPSEGKSLPKDDTDLTQPSEIFINSDDDDTCQFA